MEASRVVWWVVFCLLSLVSDQFTVRWHELREQGKAKHAAAVSALLEGFSWAPVWFAIQENDPGIMLASIVGAALGTYIGMRK